MSNMSIIFNLFYFILYKAYSNLKGVANCRKNKGVYATSINVYIKKEKNIICRGRELVYKYEGWGK